MTLTTAEPGYAWVNALRISARGTVDLDQGEAHVMGYVVYCPGGLAVRRLPIACPGDVRARVPS